MSTANSQPRQPDGDDADRSERDEHAEQAWRLVTGQATQNDLDDATDAGEV